MSISAQDVKQLRDMTGAGMMDCKKALQETNGDLQAAVEWLQVKGIAKAQKKAGRVAAEGLINSWLSADQSYGVLVEVNCETDFVSRNEGFIAFVDTVTRAIGESGLKDSAQLEQVQVNGKSLADYTTEQITVIGENIKVRRFVRFDAADGQVGAYLHTNSQIGVLIQLEGRRGDDVQQFIRDVAMHATAMRPAYLSPDVISEEAAAKQAELFHAQLVEEGKKEAMIPKIVEGKMRKWRNENSFLEQPYVKNPDITVSQYQQEVGGVRIAAFARFEVGEGIEKQQSDFAAEVAAMQKG